MIVWTKSAKARLLALPGEAWTLDVKLPKAEKAVSRKPWLNLVGCCGSLRAMWTEGTAEEHQEQAEEGRSLHTRIRRNE